jgi:hypothetical protein
MPNSNFSFKIQRSGDKGEILPEIKFPNQNISLNENKGEESLIDNPLIKNEEEYSLNTTPKEGIDLDDLKTIVRLIESFYGNFTPDNRKFLEEVSELKSVALSIPSYISYKLRHEYPLNYSYCFENDEESRYIFGLDNPNMNNISVNDYIFSLVHNNNYIYDENYFIDLMSDDCNEIKENDVKIGGYIGGAGIDIRREELTDYIGGNENINNLTIKKLFAYLMDHGKDRRNIPYSTLYTEAIQNLFFGGNYEDDNNTIKFRFLDSMTFEDKKDWIFQTGPALTNMVPFELVSTIASNFGVNAKTFFTWNIQSYNYKNLNEFAFARDSKEHIVKSFIFYIIIKTIYDFIDNPNDVNNVENITLIEKFLSYTKILGGDTEGDTEDDTEDVTEGDTEGGTKLLNYLEINPENIRNDSNESKYKLKHLIQDGSGNAIIPIFIISPVVKRKDNKNFEKLLGIFNVYNFNVLFTQNTDSSLDLSNNIYLTPLFNIFKMNKVLQCFTTFFACNKKDFISLDYVFKNNKFNEAVGKLNNIENVSPANNNSRQTQSNEENEFIFNYDIPDSDTSYLQFVDMKAIQDGIHFIPEDKSQPYNGLGCIKESPFRAINNRFLNINLSDVLYNRFLETPIFNNESGEYEKRKNSPTLFFKDSRVKTSLETGKNDNLHNLLGYFSDLVYLSTPLIKYISSDMTEFMKANENHESISKLLEYIGCYDVDTDFPYGFVGEDTTPQPINHHIHVWLRYSKNINQKGESENEYFDMTNKISYKIIPDTMARSKNSNNMELIICFRGSKTAEDWDNTDQFITSGEAMATMKISIFNKISQKIIEDTRNFINKTIRKDESLTLYPINIQTYTCGHSLGGFYATVFSSYSMAYNSLTSEIGLTSSNISIRRFAIPIVFNPFYKFKDTIYSVIDNLPAVHIHRIRNTNLSPRSNMHQLLGFAPGPAIFDDLASCYYADHHEKYKIQLPHIKLYEYSNSLLRGTRYQLGLKSIYELQLSNLNSAIENSSKSILEFIISSLKDESNIENNEINEIADPLVEALGIDGANELLNSINDLNGLLSNGTSSQIINKIMSNINELAVISGISHGMQEFNGIYSQIYNFFMLQRFDNQMPYVKCKNTTGQIQNQSFKYLQNIPFCPPNEIKTADVKRITYTTESSLATLENPEIYLSSYTNSKGYYVLAPDLRTRESDLSNLNLDFVRNRFLTNLFTLNLTEDLVCSNEPPPSKIEPFVNDAVVDEGRPNNMELINQDVQNTIEKLNNINGIYTASITTASQESRLNKQKILNAFQRSIFYDAYNNNYKYDGREWIQFERYNLFENPILSLQQIDARRVTKDQQLYQGFSNKVLTYTTAAVEYINWVTSYTNQENFQNILDIMDNKHPWYYKTAEVAAAVGRHYVSQQVEGTRQYVGQKVEGTRQLVGETATRVKEGTTSAISKATDVAKKTGNWWLQNSATTDVASGKYDLFGNPLYDDDDEEGGGGRKKSKLHSKTQHKKLKTNKKSKTIKIQK